MSRVAFFYLNGTDPLIARLASFVGQFISQPQLGVLKVPGYNGITTTWINGAPSNDPFCNLLDPQVFQATKLLYPALGIPMSVSLNIGITSMVTAINNLPRGQKFMIGGYSQGAVAAGMVQNMLRPGGQLSSRSSDWLGGICFGSPVRQQDYRGEVGGTWSGTWDNPGSSGGHGSFPTTGPFPRLNNCDPTKWIEFVDEGDIFAANGDSPTGLAWTNGCAAFVNLLNIPAVLNAIGSSWNGIQAAFAKGAEALTYTDAAGRVFSIGGSGHAAYPWRPPPGNPDNGLTSFQIAVKWLLSKAAASAVSPILLPSLPGFSPTNAGWSTVLTPPAS